MQINPSIGDDLNLIDDLLGSGSLLEIGPFL
jgi:hypothetical protein